MNLQRHLSPGTCLIRDAAAGVWLGFEHPLEQVMAWRPDQVLPALERVQSAVRRQGRHAAGFVSYEAAPAFDSALRVRSDRAFPLLWFGLYGPPSELSPPAGGSDGLDLLWRSTLGFQDYRAALTVIRRFLAAGDTYQANFSFRLRAQVPEGYEPVLLDWLMAQQPSCGALVSLPDWLICSASPELFFEREEDRIRVRPMKGTISRGPDTERDRLLGSELAASAKNRAENLMIVDMVRDDLGKIARTGSVTVPRLFQLEPYPTVWQMTSTVAARTGAGLAQIFSALFPGASITGAPKPRTTAILADLESTPRRIYTGAIGFLRPGGRWQFNVAIRTLLLDRRQGRAEYGIGGGIVWDSEVAAEWREAVLKARVLYQGDGGFRLLETLLWRPGRGYFLLRRHLRRLAGSAAYFGFALDLPSLETALLELERGLGPEAHRVRILVARDGRAELQHQLLTATRVSRRPRLIVATGPVHSDDPFLYHKTTRREVYQRHLDAHPGHDDVLLWNERGELTESCLANVVVALEGRLYTPPVRCGLLAGTYRDWLLERGRVTERLLRLQDLARCSRVYLVNSVRGMRRAQLTRASAAPRRT